MTKARALTGARKAQERLNKAEASATAAAEIRDATVATAQLEGATYREIQDATGLSTTRVTQILRRQRRVS